MLNLTIFQKQINRRYCESIFRFKHNTSCSEIRFHLMERHDDYSNVWHCTRVCGKGWKLDVFVVGKNLYSQNVGVRRL